MTQKSFVFISLLVFKKNSYEVLYCNFMMHNIGKISSYPLSQLEVANHNPVLFVIVYWSAAGPHSGISNLEQH